MRVTQQDIARIAQVSQATVSRVVAGDHRVEQDIRQRVIEVMQLHNYRPDVRARSLRQQRTHLIGLVMRREAKDLQGDPFFSLFVSEILGFLSKTPYHLCVDIAASALKQEDVYDELLRTRRVDGLILVESEPDDPRYRSLQREGFPFVLIGNPGAHTEMMSVDNDNVLAGEMATTHLLESGYRKIGFIAGPETLTVSRDRVQGYCNAVEAQGMKGRIWYSEFGYEAARESARAALASNDRPDALVVLDDFMALGVFDAAREIALNVPSQLGVISFNDTNLCEMIPGGLSSISLDIEGVVRKACSKLLRKVEGLDDPEETRTIVPCHLRARGSSRRTPEVSLV